MEFKYLEALQYYTSVCLNVTEDCNLACNYCFVKKQPTYMTLDIALNTVDNIYKNVKKVQEILNIQTNPKSSYQITFFGGEPLLCYDTVIKPTVEYCENNYPDAPWIFCITTNGILLTEEKIQFFKKHNFQIQISIDGDKDTQNFNRPFKNKENSFDILYKNLQLIQKYDLPIVHYRGTVTQERVEHLFEDYLFFEQNKLFPLILQPELKHNWTKEQCDILSEQIEKIFIYRIYQFDHGYLPMPLDNIDRAYNDILKNDVFMAKTEDTQFDPYFKTLSTCGVGTGRTVTINPIGKIYGCQERTSYNFKNYNIFEIGENGKINIEKHKKLFQSVQNDFAKDNGYKVAPNELINCNQCFLKNTCNFNFGCVSSGYDHGQANIRPFIQCFYKNELIKNAYTELQYLDEINKLNILDYYLRHTSQTYIDLINYEQKGDCL